MEVKQVSLSSVIYRSNYRQSYDESFVETVAADMAENGYSAAHPMEVYADGDSYVVIDGNTRYHAAQLGSIYDIRTRLPMMLVYVAIEPRPASDGELALQQVSANKARRDTDPISDGMAYKRAIDSGISVSEIARRAYTTIPAVQDRLTLLALIPEARELVVKRHLPIKYAVEMARLNTYFQGKALEVYSKMRSANLDAFREVVNDLYTAQSQASMFDLATLELKTVEYVASAEKRISEREKTRAELQAELDTERAYRARIQREATAEIMRLRKLLAEKRIA